MSSLFMDIMAWKALGPLSSCGRFFGMICQDTPYLSFSQPQRLSVPPSAVSLLQISSISACVSQLTSRDMPSENEKLGPPLRAMNDCPNSSKLTTMTEPPGPGVVLVILPCPKIER